MASAIRLLTEREYDQIQIREVADDAEVALATVYRYFPSKELLYAHALVMWGNEFEAEVLGRDRNRGDDSARVKAVLRRTARAYARYPNFYKLTTLLEVTTDTSAREIFEGYSGQFEQIVGGVLLDTVGRDREIIVMLATSMLGGQLRQWSRGKSNLPAVLRTLDDAVTIIFEGR
ncbi:TetR/AcrR family transcriptional regulator [Nocardia sp. alder85J]|uniref:TetR/AcrR family transcriptional regulator n=1 Tax=Nocardia sp. alder85J TaxID=2862949 RepID=UPI001CD36025|nr:TetR/AcrR family transcriptional regulator [Nocardia sp. alder85J]MCX4096768.1 TetR/AcrR family transcriptional regulator [Nocardia sp. alder85J]